MRIKPPVHFLVLEPPANRTIYTALCMHAPLDRSCIDPPFGMRGSWLQTSMYKYTLCGKIV